MMLRQPQDGALRSFEGERVAVFDQSPPGSWRAALDRNARCAVCKQSVCAHSDLEYAGLMPVRDVPAGAHSPRDPAGLPPATASPFHEASHG